MRVTVFHNDFFKVAMRSPTTGYQPGDVLTQVDEFESSRYIKSAPITGIDVSGMHVVDTPPSDDLVLETAWRVHNAVDGKERCVELGLRSLSIGDAVAIDGRLYGCSALGWQRIEEVKI